VYRAHGGFVIGSEMSGGVRNMWVSNCTFIGTDIGLRFKTTRGRGGIVENINIDNVHMKDIPGEAVLFDMYYAAQDPIKLAGEVRQPPKVEMKPVDETTPQLRNFRISNISCNGAAKGIFIRGLPEMHVQNVTISNAVLQAQEGIDIQEASGITLNNITMLSKNTNPVAYVLNSDGIAINNLKYANGADLLLQVQGERSSNITVAGTDASKAKAKLKADYGANTQAVNWR
jgi:polygalacturonase